MYLGRYYNSLKGGVIMVVTSKEVFEYLKELKKEGFHGKVILGVFDGDVNSIKLDVSVDLEYLKSITKKKGK
jgi:hypothetical protein